MNIDEWQLTIGQVRALSAIFGETRNEKIDNKMIGQYVVVRCRDAGVHSGVLESYNGRECVLTDSRRLWRWVPKSGKWLSAVANNGLSTESKVSEIVQRIHLTETCEIIGATEEARKSMQELESA